MSKRPLEGRLLRGRGFYFLLFSRDVPVAVSRAPAMLCPKGSPAEAASQPVVRLRRNSPWIRAASVMRTSEATISVPRGHASSTRTVSISQETFAKTWLGQSCQVLKCPWQRARQYQEVAAEVVQGLQRDDFLPGALLKLARDACGAGFCHRLKGKTTVTGKLTNPATTKGQSSEPVDKAKARVLKVLVRLVVVLFLAEPHAGLHGHHR